VTRPPSRPRPNVLGLLAMEHEVDLGCRCGNVVGCATAVCPERVNRVVCYCEDCQAFLHHLGRSELMDERGGTDLVQVAPSTVSYSRGAERIAGLRLSDKGLYRWYASCCNTPLGNTMAPWLPFVGIGPEAWRGAGGADFRSAEAAKRRDELFGPVRGWSFGKHAVGGPSNELPQAGAKAISAMLGKMLGWKLRRQAWPHPFFDRASKAPVPPVAVLSLEERALLRGQCGPKAPGAPRP
jgi:hypothetical protein